MVAVRDALEQATSLRMLRADVPVGSYLSGGLDSSLVAALGLRAKGSKFQTFSLRFEDAEYDETIHQRAMAEYLGSDHHEVMVTRDDIARVFPEVIYHTERPVLRTAPAPLFLLSRLVRESGIKVVLTGEGADEMFAGYDFFREAKVRRFWARQPAIRCAVRGCSKGSIRISSVRLSRSAPSCVSSSDRAWSAPATPGFGHEPRWRGCCRHSSDCSHQRSASRRPAARLTNCSLAFPPGSGRGARWRRISTSRCTRCCPAICSRRRAIGC